MKNSEALALGIGIGGAAVVADHVIKNLPPFGDVLNAVSLLYCRQNNPEEFDRFVMNFVRDEWQRKSSFQGVTSLPLPIVGRPIRPIVVSDVWDSFFRSHGIALTDAERERIGQKLMIEFWDSRPGFNVDFDSLKRVNVNALTRKVGGRKKGGKKRNSFRASADPKFIEAQCLDAEIVAPRDPVQRTALAFLKEMRNANSGLTDLTAMREIKRVIRPLIPSEFSRPIKPKKKRIASHAALERMLALYHEQVAKQSGFSVDEAAALTRLTQVPMQQWFRIVRTEFADADEKKVLAVRSELYAVRRRLLPPKHRKTKKRKG